MSDSAYLFSFAAVISVVSLYTNVPQVQAIDPTGVPPRPALVIVSSPPPTQRMGADASSGGRRVPKQVGTVGGI